MRKFGWRVERCETNAPRVSRTGGVAGQRPIDKRPVVLLQVPDPRLVGRERETLDDDGDGHRGGDADARPYRPERGALEIRQDADHGMN